MIDPSRRIVTQMPLTELWTSEGPIAAERGDSIGPERIAELLRAGRVRLVIANCGDPLRWTQTADLFSVWKREIKPRVVAPTGRFGLDDFPGGYCYFASEWNDGSGSPIVLLEMSH